MKITTAPQSNLYLKVAYVMGIQAIPLKWIKFYTELRYRATKLVSIVTELISVWVWP